MANSSKRVSTREVRRSLRVLSMVAVLWCMAGVAGPVLAHDPESWRAEFAQIADQDLQAARTELAALRDEALDRGDAQAMVTFAQVVAQHERFSADLNESLDDLDQLLASGALNGAQAREVRAARVAVLIHQRDLGQAQVELHPLMSNAVSPSEQANVRMLQGHLHQAAGEYADAVAAYIAALEWAADAWPPQRLAVLYNSLGNTNHYLRQYDEAETYLRRALQIYEAQGLTRDSLAVIAGLGGTLRTVGRVDQAIALYQESLPLVEAVAFPDLRAQFYMNLGNTFNTLERYEEGLAATSEALAISEAHGIDYGVALSHLNIGFIHYRTARYDEALAAYDLAYAFFQGEAFQYERRQLLRNYADLYAAMGEFQLAHQFERRHSELDRTLVNLEARTASEEIQTRYETQLKDAELSLNQATITRQRGQLLALTTVLLILITATLIIVLFMAERNRNLQAIYERNRDLARRPALRPVAVAQPDSEAESLSDSQLEGSRHLFEVIVKVMENQALFAKSDLSLADVAATVHSNTSYVSRAIAEHADSNFNSFVNTFRVQAARRMIHDANGEVTIQGLIDACGFNSRSSFYRSFDRLVGLSPSQYIRRSKQDALLHGPAVNQDAMKVDTQPADQG